MVCKSCRGLIVLSKLPMVFFLILFVWALYWITDPGSCKINVFLCDMLHARVSVFFFQGFLTVHCFMINYSTVYYILYCQELVVLWRGSQIYIYIYLCATYTYIFYIFSLYFSSHESHFPSCPASCEKSRMRKAHFYWILLASTPCPRVTNGSSMMQRFKKFRKSKTERRGKQRRNVATSSGLGGWMVWWAACKSLKNVLVFL